MELIEQERQQMVPAQDDAEKESMQSHIQALQQQNEAVMKEYQRM